MAKKINLTLKYSIVGLPRSEAVQRTYVDGNTIYVIQLKNHVDAYISRCTLNTTTGVATQKDYMVIKDSGHGQTIFYDDGYFWITCKAYSEDYQFGCQIARIKYKAGKTYDSYSEISDRLTHLCYYNGASTTKMGAGKRVEMAINDNKTELFIWLKCVNGYVLSRYDFSKIKALIENGAVHFKGNSSIKKALLSSKVLTLAQAKKYSGDGTGKNQGMCYYKSNRVAVCSGDAGATPTLRTFNPNVSNCSTSWTFNVPADKTFFKTSAGNQPEIEGLQKVGTEILVGFTNKKFNPKTKKVLAYDKTDTTRYQIYSFPASILE